ncbi:hypothetical protein OQ968_00420 [Mycobacterium sp. 663a-19]|uniref:Rv1733c family protein n=1 Tax=Mycobacterium sp. 663a-19 TaxID=2986148 RepID=UPI002D1F26D0|nr:hypothetical protein [Mycobacterium sp. 663a-19]MEB3979727.1 hypothetical protein [Mycobacterium sp. 663a-19]
MITPRHDDRRRGARARDDHAAMETFTVPLPRRLLVRLFGLNPLIRPSDRLEALILVLAVALSLVTVPIAAAVGTSVHDSRRSVYAEQAQTRRPVTATVIGDSHPRRNLESPTVTVPARWFAAGTEHTGDVVAPLGVKVGEEIEIWVDQEGAAVGKPERTAVDEAVAFAMAIWWTVSLSAVALFGGARIALDRRRAANWQRDFDRLVGKE